MKLNCDMGESFGPWKMGKDAEIMPYVDMANIACGFHASDPQTMSDTVALALKHQVAIGAHPGYPDLIGFGRKDMQFTSAEIRNIVLYQVGALQAICASHNTELAYVKPHGALYNAMMSNHQIYRALLQALSSFDFEITLMIMATPNDETYAKMAEKFGVKLLFEAFCDRAYTDDGKLQSRHIAGAAYDNLDTIKHQAKQLITEQSITTTSGKIINLHVDTICIHGDGVYALESVRAIRSIVNSL